MLPQYDSESTHNKMYIDQFPFGEMGLGTIVLRPPSEILSDLVETQVPRLVQDKPSSIASN